MRRSVTVVPEEWSSRLAPFAAQGLTEPGLQADWRFFPDLRDGCAFRSDGRRRVPRWARGWWPRRPPALLTGPLRRAVPGGWRLWRMRPQIASYQKMGMGCFAAPGCVGAPARPHAIGNGAVRALAARPHARLGEAHAGAPPGPPPFPCNRPILCASRDSWKTASGPAPDSRFINLVRATMGDGTVRFRIGDARSRSP